MARPNIKIDKTQFEKLCGLQCTLSEIAGWFSCSEDTIERWCNRTYKKSFSQVYSAKREAGKISLRRFQFKLAEKNAAMAIFLGKNLLGQSDDPRKYEKEETAENKLDKLLDTVTQAIITTAPDVDSDNNGDNDES